VKFNSVTSGNHEFALARVELVDYSPLTKMLVLELGDDNGNVRSKRFLMYLFVLRLTVLLFL